MGRGPKFGLKSKSYIRSDSDDIMVYIWTDLNIYFVLFSYFTEVMI